MDLSCPSFLLDQLELNDETSEYGSRETSDSESTIGGLCLLEGYHKSQGDKVLSHKCFYFTFLYIQREPSPSEETVFFSTQRMLKVIKFHFSIYASYLYLSHFLSISISHSVKPFCLSLSVSTPLCLF